MSCSWRTEPRSTGARCALAITYMAKENCKVVAQWGGLHLPAPHRGKTDRSPEALALSELLFQPQDQLGCTQPVVAT